MKGRIYVDISSEEKYGEGLDELLRLIFDQPRYPEPGLGTAPEYLKAEGGGLPLAKEFPAALRAIREGKSSREGLESLFVKGVLAELDRQYVRTENVSGYDEQIYQAILKTKGLRDQMAEYANTVASFGGDNVKAVKPCVWLLEEIGRRFGPPVENGPYQEGWADIYRFFALELVLVFVAALLRHERWDMLRNLLKYPYLVRTTYAGLAAHDISVFDSSIVSMDEHRNNRLKSNRASLTADMLKERCSREHTQFSEIVQADVLLTLNSVVHFVERSGANSHTFWFPRTVVYSSELRCLPIFVKAIDSDIRRGIWTAVNLASASEFATRVEAARARLDDFRALSTDRSFRFSFADVTNLAVLMSATGSQPTQ